MSLLDDFARVSRKHPCPVCHKTDWCLYSRTNPGDPDLVICTRVESPTRWGEAGWIHRLKGGRRSPRSVVRTVHIGSQRNNELAELHERVRCLTDHKAVHALAAKLDVTVESLVRLEVGAMLPEDLEPYRFHPGSRGWTFPMRDAYGNIIGLRIRLVDGPKLAIQGSKNGLFIPNWLPTSLTRLLIAEGESDTAALLDLGFDVIGRPGCTNGRALVVRFARRVKPQEIVVVADNDEGGISGARSLARELAAQCTCVRLITPPTGVKDARAWKCAGATREEIERVTDAAPVVRLSVRRAE